MASYAVPGTLPDEDLVRRCRQGDETAFTLLYHRYKHRVLRTACRIIRDPEDAQDATQEIFLKAYLSIRQWNSAKSRLSTWLYRLATNHAIDCWRAQRRRKKTETAVVCIEDCAQANLAVDSCRGPDHELDRNEQARALSSCVETLPQLQKRIFILRHYRGLSLLDIACKEGRSLGTVKGSLFRASRSLGRMLRSRNGRQCTTWKLTIS